MNGFIGSKGPIGPKRRRCALSGDGIWVGRRAASRSQHQQIEDSSPGRGGARVIAKGLICSLVSFLSERKVIHREFFTTTQSDRSRFFAKPKPGGPKTIS